MRCLDWHTLKMCHCTAKQWKQTCFSFRTTVFSSFFFLFNLLHFLNGLNFPKGWVCFLTEYTEFDKLPGGTLSLQLPAATAAQLILSYFWLLTLKFFCQFHLLHPKDPKRETLAVWVPSVFSFEKAALLVCCEVPEMFCGWRNLAWVWGWVQDWKWFLVEIFL